MTHTSWNDLNEAIVYKAFMRLLFLQNFHRFLCAKASLGSN